MADAIFIQMSSWLSGWVRFFTDFQTDSMDHEDVLRGLRLSDLAYLNKIDGNGVLVNKMEKIFGLEVDKLVSRFECQQYKKCEICK